MARKARKKTKKTTKKRTASFVQDGRGSKILGMILLASAVFLFFACAAYLFTWKADFNHVSLASGEYLFNQNYGAANFLGKLGALASHILMYKGIGIMAFLPIFMLAKTGWVFLFGLKSERLLREWQWCLYLSVFLSVFFAFAFSNVSLNIGGNIGGGIRDFLTKLLGALGLGFLFFLILGLIIIWLFNPEFKDLSIRKWIAEFPSFSKNLFSNRKEKKSSKVKTKEVVVDEEEEFNEISASDYLMGMDLSSEAQEEKVEVNETPTEVKIEIQESELNDEFEIITPETESELNTVDHISDFSDLQKSTETLLVEKENADHLEPYDPTKDLSNYQHPSLELLEIYNNDDVATDRAELQEKKEKIEKTLNDYKIGIKKITATVGPTVTLYEIVPATGVRISKIRNLEDDIALSLAALGIRIIAPIPGKGTIGIEVPNKKRQIVGLREILQSKKFQHAKMDLPIALGKTISAEVFIADLAKMPHLLVAGATGQGKSVGINAILASILYKKHPSQVKLVLVDPKKVELSIYSDIENHFLAYLPDAEEPILTETRKVVNTLNSICIEMDDRYNLLKKARTRNIKEYNEKFIKRQLNPDKGHRFLPFIVLVIDEFADLIMTAGKEVELPIARLAQLARAVGIHLIIATQRPSVNIITGMIKANFPARLAFKVTSGVDSKTILDTPGAERLVGQGDMLLSVGGKTIRLQCAFIDTPEVEKLVDSIADQKSFPKPYFLPEYKTDDDEEGGVAEITLRDLDELFDESALLVFQANSGSTSMIQRKLKIGYNRAGRIMDQLEHFGIVGPARGSKPREVLIHSEAELDNHIRAIRNMESS